MQALHQSQRRRICTKCKSVALPPNGLIEPRSRHAEVDEVVSSPITCPSAERTLGSQLGERPVGVARVLRGFFRRLLAREPLRAAGIEVGAQRSPIRVPPLEHRFGPRHLLPRGLCGPTRLRRRDAQARGLVPDSKAAR